MCFHVPIYTAHVLYDGINWKLLTYLAALDAFLVTKGPFIFYGVGGAGGI